MITLWFEAWKNEDDRIALDCLDYARYRLIAPFAEYAYRFTGQRFDVYVITDEYKRADCLKAVARLLTADKIKVTRCNLKELKMVSYFIRPEELPVFYSCPEPDEIFTRA